MSSVTLKEGAVSAPESTTLVTFFLLALPTTHTVELFGSWDNFSTSYPMAKDSRRGRGHWRGIHIFQNIICDGDPSNVNTKRHGALRAGGLYWYFYRLNGDLEHHNPSEPSTTTCPLLPGQRVNILEVPIELSCLSPSAQELREVMTLNPKDRWAPLKHSRSAQATLSSEGSQVEKKRKEYLEKALGRKYTADADMIILASKGYKAPNSAAEDAEIRSTRPKSCSAISNRHKSSLHAARLSYLSQISSSSTDSQDCAISRTRRVSAEGVEDSRRSHAKGQKQLQLQSPISFSGACEILFSHRSPASRPRTAVPSLSNAGRRPASSRLFTTTSSNLTNKVRRSNSAPKAVACPTPQAENVMDRIRSVRLRVACAKLRTLQSDPNRSPSDNSWIMNELPENFSGVLSKFRTADAERKLNQPTNGTLLVGEISQSPQQSTSSRQSTLWTPDTGSVGTAPPSDVWESSQRGSFRYSLQSALTLYDEENDDLQDHANKDGGSADALGLQFSSLGLGSQETIKPPRTITVDPKPLDSEWNPFSGLIGVGRKSAQTRDKPVTQGTNNSNEMMNELSFLGTAIA